MSKEKIITPEVTGQPITNILRMPAVMARVGLCKVSIYAAIKQSGFPQPVPLSGRSVGWVESEVEAWLRRRAEMRKGTR